MSTFEATLELRIMIERCETVEDVVGPLGLDGSGAVC